MPSAETIFFAAVVVLLVVVGAIAIRTQVLLLRGLRDFQESEDERTHLRRRARRRIVAAGMMLTLAVMIAGTMIFLEGHAEELADVGPVAADAPENRDFLNLYRWSWIVILLVLMGLVLLAGYDLWVVRRHWMKQWRKLQQDRRDMIAEETSRMRRGRNGRH